MPTHTEKRVVPFTAEQMFDLVAGIEKYPEFLPWCRGARIHRREGNVVYADLIIGWKMFRERFTSRVLLDRPHTIEVTYLDGPLKHLQNRWHFKPLPGGRCEIDFYVDFEFRSPLFQKAIALLFNEVVTRMVRAFEGRAQRLYGRKSPPAEPAPAENGPETPTLPETPSRP